MYGTALDAAGLLSASKTQTLDDLLVRLCNIVQLSSTQFALAEDRYHAICDWLGAPESALSRFRPDLYPQGSVALGTTVRPLIGEEYDVDLVCQLDIDYRSVSTPVLLLNAIEARMRENDRYKQKLERKKRCLRVNYQNDFHLDILPACPNLSVGGTSLLIPDRTDNEWQASNPKGFVKWFQAKGALRMTRQTQKAMDAAAPLPQPQTAEQKTTLQLSVQLIKRWRDVHYGERIDVAPVSIVLTTLMGDHYYGEQSVSSNLLSSVDAILGSLPEDGKLHVTNPSDPQESLSERWEDDDEKYEAFVDGMRILRSQLGELIASDDMGRRSAILQRMFGEKVTKEAFTEQARTIEEFRNSQKMKVQRSTAGIVSLSATASTPVPRNTFYGEPAKKEVSEAAS